MTATIARMSTTTHPAEAPALRPAQLAWLAAAVFVVSAGYGALMPVLPGWLGSMMPGASTNEISRHVGFFSGVYAAGVLLGALFWGVASDRVGRGRILIIGLIGYVATLLLMLIPTVTGLWGLYALRGATGFFVAAVVPVVSALVAEHTPKDKRARRFAWLSAMSLLGFLFGPGLIQVADGVGFLAGIGPATAATSARTVIVLSAILGAVMMLGLARALPPLRAPATAGPTDATTNADGHTVALCWLSVMVTVALAGFEVGIVLQGQQHADMSTRRVALMFAQCSLVMLLVNAILFFTGVLEKVSSRALIAAGLVLAAAGLAVMAWHSADTWLYLGISLTSAGTGLVLPVIAYLAAGVPHHKLGTTMGALAAASGLGQTLGSSLSGWRFGVIAQLSFGLLMLPLMVMFVFIILRPGWWSGASTAPSRDPDQVTAGGRKGPLREGNPDAVTVNPN